MLSRCPILFKLLLGVGVLLLIVATLSFSGFRGVYSFRQLTRSIKVRAGELPLAAKLLQRVCELRVTVSKLRTASQQTISTIDPGFDKPNEDFHSINRSDDLHHADIEPALLRAQFRSDLLAVKEALRGYKQQLDSAKPSDPRIADIRKERETVREIEQLFGDIDDLNQYEDWVLRSDLPITLDAKLEEVQELTSTLPGYMTQRMDNFADDARMQYRTWIVLCWVTTVSAVLLLVLSGWYFHRWIFRPLNILIDGSRRVASGNFGHRIQLNTQDEVAELADAMNDMTSRFQEIRDDLDQQVHERTKQVVRSEQLASVGFLAAGVAHEINNPMASIAWCAEALEDRLKDIIQADDELPDDQHNEEVTILKKYLRRIQDEAFRCKGITERLLDYSRMGDVERQNTNLTELVEGVIEMVRHLGKYREKHITFNCKKHVTASVNPQELKQVVLNMITNGLDSLDLGGTVSVTVQQTNECAEIVFSDDGCGMTQEVIDHLFEPFFTRRRDGQGTGLGLSITYRIIEGHGGEITVFSAGPGQGSTFRITLPMVENEKKLEKQYQAA